MAAEGGGFTALDPCVHCGFCLPACPTYEVSGDEAESPRGRIVLMRALERGELPPTDPDLALHLDQCLGCRACEPACPSGVGYGEGLAAARQRLFAARETPPLLRALLGVFARPPLARTAFAAARLLRRTGIAGALAGRGRVGFGLGMVAACAPRRRAPVAGAAPDPAARRPTGDRVALFRGCIMQGLFAHVHDATRRTLEANGYVVVEVPGHWCCGALHEHAGDHAGARRLAADTWRRLDLAAVDHVVVNSAGCGAALKGYGHLLGAGAAALAAKVRDVSELLAARGPRPGAPLDLDVAYDAPCHLQHAQRVHEPALAVLRAVPGLRWRLLPGSDRCCGSAGAYAVTHPALGRAVLDEKLRTFREAHPMPQVVVTGNPGCLMHIGAGLRAAGLPIEVRHPVEVLDWSYGGAVRR